MCRLVPWDAGDRLVGELDEEAFPDWARGAFSACIHWEERFHRDITNPDAGLDRSTQLGQVGHVALHSHKGDAYLWVAVPPCLVDLESVQAAQILDDLLEVPVRANLAVILRRHSVNRDDQPVHVQLDEGGCGIGVQQGAVGCHLHASTCLFRQPYHVQKVGVRHRFTITA